MKRLFKLAFLVLLMVQVSSCGKTNNSGSSSSTSGINPGTGSVSGIGTSSAGFGDYNTLKNFYVNDSFSRGLSTNMVIYHTGSYFGAQSSNFSLNGSYCINLIFKQWGDCNNGTSNQLQSILDQGEYKIVENYSASSVSYKKAVGISTYNNVSDFSYSAKVFDAQDDVYEDMLNLNNLTTRRTVVSKATIRLSNGQTIDGDLVEYFYSYNNVKRFILSSALPLLANPVAVIDNGSVSGRLNSYGSVSVTNIQATIHGLQQTWNNGILEDTVYIQQQINL